MKKIILLATTFTFFGSSISGQSFYDGSFEGIKLDCTIPFSKWFPDDSFNFYVDYINGFSENGMPLGAPQVIKDSCWVISSNHWVSPYHGHYCLVIVNDTANYAYSHGITLTLKNPLNSGSKYNLSFFYKAVLNDYRYPPMPLLVGTSNDSLDFGVQIAATDSPVMSWTRFSVNFTAPNNGQYISIKGVPLGSPGILQWTAVDSFNLSTTSSLPEEISEEFRIESLPDRIRIIPDKIHDNINVSVFDLYSRELNVNSTNNQSEYIIYTTNELPKFILLKISTTDYQLVKKVVLIK